MYFVGVDPDTHTSGVAIVDSGGALVSASLVRSPNNLSGPEGVIEQIGCIGQIIGEYTVAVENQEISYSAKDRKNPRSMLGVAQVAGAFVGLLGRGRRVFFPMPQEWKGSVPKIIHQARTFSRLGIPYASVKAQGGYCHPIHLSPWGLNKGDWKHVADAAGLALWARDKYLLDQQYAAAPTAKAQENL